MCIDIIGVTMEGKEIEQTIHLLKVLGEANRLKILYLLQKGSLCVCEIFESLSLPQNLTSHHLGVLKKVGLVDDEKKGLRVYYSLTPNGRKITKGVSEISGKGGFL